MHWRDVMFKKRYHPLLAYKQSKLCNLLFARGLNERFAGQGIRAYGVDPGLVKTDIGCKQAGGLVRLVWRLRRRGGVVPEVPARTYAYLCGEEETPTGFYYCLCREKRCSEQVRSENADRLWALSEQLCGIKWGREEQT
jgi:retinol dehydrogenase-13